MSFPTVGVLHPGQMGAAVAAELRRNDVTVFWCATGRSEATTERARTAGLVAVDDLGELLDHVDVLLSICPPAAAERLACTVATLGFRGIYVDANAISPERVGRVADVLTGVGAHVVDGAIIGPPPTGRTTARLYLAGQDAAVVAPLVDGTAVEAVVLDKPIGAASALKMAYASYQKASRTLAAVAHAYAARNDVTDHLLAEACRTARSPLADPDYLPSVAARAWRWAPEMRDVADSLTDAGLPAQLATATADVLARWAEDKDQDLPLTEVLSHLRDPYPS